MMNRLLILLAPLAASPSFAASPEPPLMTPRDLMALPTQPPDQVLRYGEEPSQFGELRLPAGPGPHPVVVLIHGGCFRADFADLKSIAAMGDALKREGIASWSLEYRRLPEPGSGWPGTYQDIGAGVDHLRVLASRHGLNLERVVLLGHSAGAHLAHWAAARSRLAANSPLYRAKPLVPLGVINLAGRMDMTVGIPEYEAGCGTPVLQRLLGGLPEDVPERYAQVSLTSLLPLRVPQVMIWGSHESYVPAAQAQAYVRAARAAGDSVDWIEVPGAGHFETASPQSTAWPTVLAAVRKLLAVESPESVSQCSAQAHWPKAGRSRHASRATTPRWSRAPG